jgi:hypothetical protein
MSKYDPLYKWLHSKASSGAKKIPMTFAQMENVLGFVLPRTARSNREWWGNEISPNSRHLQKKSWMKAGYETSKVNLTEESLYFVRVGASNTQF